MYYESKFAYYFYQYGFIVMIISLTISQLITGVLLYYNTTNLRNIYTGPIIVDSGLNPKSETNKTIEVLKNLPYDLDNLNTLEKKNVTCVEVTQYGSVICSYDNENIEIYLIGDDFSFTEVSSIKKMRQDLVSKNIQIAFDESKKEVSRYYGYVYLNDKLYNVTLLEDGLVKLRLERTNVAFLNNLTKAESDAKYSKTGIWKASI